MARPELEVTRTAPRKRVAIYALGSGSAATDWFADKWGKPCVFYPNPYSTKYLDAEEIEDMLTHPKVAQAVNNLINAIVGDGPRWIPAVSPYGRYKDRYDEAEKYADFLNWQMREPNGLNRAKLRQLVDCVIRRNKVASKGYTDMEVGIWKGKRVLTDISIFPNGGYAFRRNSYGDTVALDVSTREGVKTIGRENFLVFSFRPHNDNPYGDTALQAARDPYYESVQNAYEAMAYLTIYGGGGSIFVFAGPMPEGYIPHVGEDGRPDGQDFPLYDFEGNAIMVADPESGEPVQAYGTQEQQNLIILKEYKARSVYSLPYESKVQLMEAQQGGAEMFRESREKCDEYIMCAIYGSAQLTETKGNLSTVNAEVGEGVAGLNVNEGKLMAEVALENDFAREGIAMNWGEAAARDLLPICDLGSGQNARAPKMMNSTVGFVNSGAFDKDQWFWWCAFNGLPLPRPGVESVVPRQTPQQAQGPGGGDKTSQGSGA